MSLVNSQVFEGFRQRLLEKRHNLTQWLQTTPGPKKQIRLGPAGEQDVHAHLAVLDTALEAAEAETLGLCTICHEHIETERLEMDYTACVCIDHLSPEEIRRLEYELELSQVVQKALMPQHIPEILGLEIAAFSRPTEIVGGDYFDFFRFADGSHGLTIADVAGKGVSASLLMATVQTALRALVPLSESPAEVLRQVNRLFYHNINFTTFVTLFLGSFDPGTQTLTYSSAGHNPPLVFCKRPNGREPISWLRPTGPAIGLVEEPPFTLNETRLSPGDMLLLYTDGVTEAINPQEEQFGEARLAALVQNEPDLSPQELIGVLRQSLLDFTAGQPPADDTTILAYKVAEP